MNRKQLLASIRSAGYHEDADTGTRLLIENRVSMQVYNREFMAGRRMKDKGIKCTCSDCNK